MLGSVAHPSGNGKVCGDHPPHASGANVSKATEKGTPTVAVDCMWIWADRPGWALECASLVWEDKPGQRGQPPSLEKATNLRLLPAEHGPSGSVTVSQGAAPLRRMQPQGPIFVGLPHLGPVIFCLLTGYSVTDWCKGLRTLSWCPPHKTILVVWTATYCLMGYASYLVWKDLGGGCKWNMVLPLGLYAVQLPISWAVLMLLLKAANPGLALLHLLLLYGLVVSMVLVWLPINKLATLLLLPYLAWLTVTVVLIYRLWRDSLCPTAQPQLTEESGS